MRLDEDVLEKYFRAGRIARAACKLGADMVREGNSLLKVAEEVEAYIRTQGANLAFPVNISIDSTAAHFTPKSTDHVLVFRRGQVVKIDVGAHIDGYIADTAMTVEVVTSEWRDLIKAAEEALHVAIDLLRPGVDLSIVGQAVDQTIRSFGFRPIENLTGHSLDRYNLHGGISIPNVSKPDKARLRTGDVVAVEPFATNGRGHVDGHLPGNIFRLKRDIRVSNREANALLDIIKSWPPLPFSERDCVGLVENHQKALAYLVRKRALHAYLILSEELDARVSQAEHTVVITDSCPDVITL